MIGFTIRRLLIEKNNPENPVNPVEKENPVRKKLLFIRSVFPLNRYTTPEID